MGWFNMGETTFFRVGGDLLEDVDGTPAVLHAGENGGHWLTASGYPFMEITNTESYTGDTSLRYKATSPTPASSGNFYFNAEHTVEEDVNKIEFAIKIPPRDGNKEVRVRGSYGGFLLFGISLYRSGVVGNLMQYLTNGTFVTSDYTLADSVWHKMAFVYSNERQIYKIQHYDEINAVMVDITKPVTFYNSAGYSCNAFGFQTVNTVDYVYLDDIGLYSSNNRTLNDFLLVTRFTAKKKIRSNAIKNIDSSFSTKQISGFKPWEYTASLLLLRKDVDDSVYNYILSYFRNFRNDGAQIPLSINVGGRTYNIYCESINITSVGGGKSSKIDIVGREWSDF